MSHKLSKTTRYAQAISKVEGAKGEIETLKNELQNWLGGMPENLQDGSKAHEIEATINDLDEVIDSLEEAIYPDINFPGMI